VEPRNEDLLALTQIAQIDRFAHLRRRDVLQDRGILAQG
jgi:hypothetical protein